MASNPTATALDPRQVRTRHRVLAAARTVLRREGLGGATLDAIATEAGVARSTLYRNWPNREELLAEAFDDLVAPPVVTDPRLPIEERLAAVLIQLARGLGTSEWGGTLPAVVAAIDADPVLAERYGRVTNDRRSAVRDLVTTAVERSELPAAMPVDDLIDALVGPLFYRRLVRQTPTSRAWVVRHLDRTLTAFGHRVPSP